MSTYVISDIHGRLKELENILSKLNIDNTKDKIYFLGDYVDWGPDSIGVINKCMQLEHMGIAKCLMGNHDKMMLDVITKCSIVDTSDEYELKYFGDRCEYTLWAMNGGDKTLDQYCESTNEIDRANIIKWLSNLEYTVDNLVVGDKRFYLCHAYPKFKGASDYSVIWHRESPKNPNFINKVRKVFKDTIIICGHTIVYAFDSLDADGKCKIFKNRDGNIIYIDCGAKIIGHNNCGRLACLRLDDFAEFYS